MWIPDPGVRFRIVSSYIGSMFCEGNGKTSVGGIQLGECDSKTDYSYFDGSWFTLERSNVDGYYVFIHFMTNTRLYVNGDRSEEGLIGTQYHQHDDQLWQIRPKGGNSDDFQLISRHKGNKLFLRNHSNHIGVCAGNTFNYEDQYFHFYFEEPTVKSVEFNLNSAKLLQRVPRLLVEDTFANRSNTEQTNTITATYTKTESHRWAYQGGFKLALEYGLTFKIGIPYIASGETSFKLGFETTHQWTTENVETESRQMTYELPVTVSPMKKTTSKVIIHDEKAEVPYTIILKLGSSGKEVVSQGKWYGVQSVNVFHEISEENL